MQKQPCGCRVCKTWLTLHMVNPLRCGGLHYDTDGRLVTCSGELWEDIIRKNNEEQIQHRLSFLDKHKSHLELHYPSLTRMGL